MTDQVAAQDHGTHKAPSLQKTPTGIAGLDALTFGGLPEGRPTLMCGAAPSRRT